MAGNWKNKVPNKPFIDSQGRYSIVLIREGPAELSEMQSWNMILGVAQEGFQRLMTAHGKKYNQYTWGDFTGFYLERDVQNIYASSFDPVQMYGSLPRARLAHIGVSGGDYVLAKRGFDVEGPIVPPRPGVSYFLYKFSIHGRLFDEFPEKDFANRTNKIGEKGTGFYKELSFDNYEDFSKQLSEVAVTLEKYEEGHKKMQTEPATKDSGTKLFKRPEMGDPAWPDPSQPRLDHYGPLNLVDEAERLNEFNAKIKEFLRTNEVDLQKDKLVIGLYPVDDKLNPAASSDDSEVAAAPPAPEETPTPATAPPSFGSITKRSENPTYYTDQYQVQSGDTLWDIAKFYLETGGARYTEIIDANYLIGDYAQRGWRSTSKIIELDQRLAQIELEGGHSRNVTNQNPTEEYEEAYMEYWLSLIHISEPTRPY